MWDGIGHLAHLHARDTSFVLVSRAPQAKLNPFKERMGWLVPWFSSFGSAGNTAFGVTGGEEEKSGTSVFLCEGDNLLSHLFHHRTWGRNAWLRLEFS